MVKKIINENVLLLKEKKNTDYIIDRYINIPFESYDTGDFKA